ncbi:MAG: hypothetical protein JKY56_07255 [Kofleriaceae bacterium]|nr:hypothetical protein [Kofleriaceae bacterium]
MSNASQRIQNLSHASLITTVCFGLLACSMPPPETSAPSALAVETPAPAQETVVAKAPTPKADDLPARVEELSFVPSELSPQGDSALLEYCLDCQVRKARYTYCHFDAKELETAVGPESLSKTVTVKVEMRAQSSETYVPDDPNAPQPDDGFVHEKYKCMVVEVLSSK